MSKGIYHYGKCASCFFLFSRGLNQMEDQEKKRAPPQSFPSPEVLGPGCSEWRPPSSPKGDEWATTTNPRCKGKTHPDLFVALLMFWFCFVFFGGGSGGNYLRYWFLCFVPLCRERLTIHVPLLCYCSWLPLVPVKVRGKQYFRRGDLSGLYTPGNVCLP